MTLKHDLPTTIARYYRGARTVHIERLAHFTPGDFLYYKPMYDFDDELARRTPGVRRVTFAHVFSCVLRRRYEVLELAEPFTPSALPQNLALALASRLSAIGGKTPTRFVTYAIENADLSAKIARKFRVPGSLITPIVSNLVYFCYSRFDRIAFGTAAAEHNYKALLGTRRFNRSRPAHTLIWGLPASQLTASRTRPQRLLFLGALDDRKGILQLMDAWDAVSRLVPQATLTILGKGKYASRVEQWAEQRDEVSLIVNPSRETIGEELLAGKALFLLSQPSALWKEQIGLPILEGLETGLEIVASTETGVAGWLADNGHQVLDPDCDTKTVALAIERALSSSRTPAEVAGDLPNVDGRFAADCWLFESHTLARN
ncbi:glycosyltransferase [Microterricola viridarii]|uniref:Glycosyl transferases group 1 n=1 Tax=Microterricola viridarii TaxID=412690 RepID=A0A1H1ZJE5_9MICO|nr:glycosyltransferase [Microterricola viridarii]SDT33697.1 Glycosyl transferases group 1 [Microterricola viridarii]